jgi:hypothetical protein
VGRWNGPSVYGGCDEGGLRLTWENVAIGWGAGRNVIG